MGMGYWKEGAGRRRKERGGVAIWTRPSLEGN